MQDVCIRFTAISGDIEGGCLGKRTGILKDWSHKGNKGLLHFNLQYS